MRMNFTNIIGNKKNNDIEVGSYIGKNGYLLITYNGIMVFSIDPHDGRIEFEKLTSDEINHLKEYGIPIMPISNCLHHGIA